MLVSDKLVYLIHPSECEFPVQTRFSSNFPVCLDGNVRRESRDKKLVCYRITVLDEFSI